MVYRLCFAGLLLSSPPMILAKWRDATCWRRICGAAKWAARAVARPYCGACCAGCSGSFRSCPSAWWAMPALPFPRCTSLASAGESNAASASAAIPPFNGGAKRWQKKRSAAGCGVASGSACTAASGIAVRARTRCKAEHGSGGSTLRFVISNRPGSAEQVFDFYQHCGECENRIAELKNGFAADRLSCQRFLANAFRLLLHASAYNLVVLFRHRLPQPLRHAQIASLRVRLFKLGALITRSVRRVVVHGTSGWPFQRLWQNAFQAVASG